MAWPVVLCCITTPNVKTKVKEDYSTTLLLQGFSWEADYSKKSIVWQRKMKRDICDLKSKVSKTIKIDFKACPIGGHNVHRKVKRKTQGVNKSIEKTMFSEQLSLI